MVRILAAPLPGGLNLRKVALLGAAVLAVLALMLGNQTGAKADTWNYTPCTQPYGMCFGTWASGAYSGGVMNNYFVGIWEFADVADGSWGFGVCLQLHGDPPDVNAPWNGVSQGGRVDLNQVQYILQFMWPNPASNPYPADDGGPSGNKGYVDDPNYNAAAIQLGVWRITDGFNWPTSCNGCNLAELQASYTYVANTSDAHFNDSRICYNHTGFMTAPNDPDGINTPANGSAFTTTPGNNVNFTIWGKLVGDLPRCQGAAGTEMSGGRVNFEAWAGTGTTVSYNGAAFGSYSSICCGPSGANGTVGAGLSWTPGPPGVQVSVTVRVTIRDTPVGAQLAGLGGHAPNGLQLMGIDQPRCNWTCGDVGQWVETRTYYSTTTDAKPCGQTLTENLTRDGNIGNISQATKSPTVNGGDSIRTYWDMWNCGTYGNLTNPSIDSSFTGIGTTSGWGVDFNGATAGGGATITFPGGGANADVYAAGPTLAPGQHFTVTVNSTVVATLPSGVTQPDNVVVKGTYASDQATINKPETLTNVWGVGLLDPVSAIASCGSTYGSVGVSWQAPFSGPVPSSYKVYDVTSGTRVLLGSTTGLSYQALSHPAGTAYRFNVTSVSGGVESPGGTSTADIPGTPIAMGSTPQGVAITRDGTKAYVANGTSVSVIALASNTVTATITGLGSNAIWDVAITPDGTKVYVTNTTSTVHVIATANNAVTSFAVGTGTQVKGIAITPDGTKAYTANYGAATVSVIALASNTVTATIASGQTNPYEVAITPDGTKAYVTNFGSNVVSVIATASNTVSASIPVGAGAHGVAITPDGTKAYVVNYTASTVIPITISTSTAGTAISLTGVIAGPQLIAITPDGTKAYVTTNASQVAVINLATDTLAPSVGVFANRGVAITPDGTKVYVAAGASPTFTVTPITIGSTTYTKTTAFDPAACWAITAPTVTALEACVSGSVGSHLTWTVPATYGETITSYVVSANRGGLTWTITNVNLATWTITDQVAHVTTVAGTPNTPLLDVQGLFNTTEYTFTVVAKTQHLTSSSTASNAITPSCGG